MLKKAILFLCCIVLLAASGCGGTAVAPSAPVEPESIPEPLPDPLNESAPPPPEAPEESSEPVVAAEPPPDNDWAFDSPEKHGADPAVFESLHEAASKTAIRSIVVVKDGFIIDEYYGGEYDENSVFGLASCSKSFTGALIGIAIEQGIIGGTDERLADYLPRFDDAADERMSQITIEHLLTHTSGIEWYEWGDGRTFSEFTRSENWIDFILGRRVIYEPGSTFAYTTGGSHLLAAILGAAAGESAYDFGKKHMFQPMGMDSVEWRSDPQGITDGGNGISMTARDAAKFGQLYLDGGRWRDRQIIPEAWALKSVQVQHARSGSSGSYGYQWWLRPFGAGNYDTYYAMGHAGQYIFVVPKLGLVTVITSRFRSDTYAPWPYFTDYVLAAFDEI